MSNHFENYQEHALTKPRDEAWDNWAKFEKVGDKVQGYIVDVFFRKAQGIFADQRGLTLKQQDGTLINVGIKCVDFVLKRTDDLRLGDPVTAVFEKESAAKVSGHNPTKIINYYGQNIEASANNKTVLELYNIDKGLEEAKEAAEIEAGNAEMEGLVSGNGPAAVQPAAVAPTPVQAVAPAAVAPVTPVAAQPVAPVATQPAAVAPVAATPGPLEA